MIARHPNPCDHPGQDAIHGKGYRVMNPVKTDGREPAYRCTCCAPPKVHSQKRGGIYLLSTLQVKR